MVDNAFDTLRNLSPTSANLGAPEPSWSKLIGASLEDKYASSVNFLNEQIKFGFDPKNKDPNFNAIDHIPEGLEKYTHHLISAENADQLTFKVNNLYRALKVDETLSRSSFGALAISEFVDPINYISLPLRAAKTIGGGFRAGAISTGGVALAQEAIRYPIDPTVTALESGLNIGASAIFGGAINSMVSIPAARRFKAAQDAETEIGELNKALRGDGVQATTVAGGPDASIPENIFTDSWIYKSATTPMKRIITNPNIPNDVKLDTLAIANDSGILLSANKKGQKIGNSVFQNAKLHQGTWVKAYDEIATIWGESTGSGVTKPLDYMTKRKSFEEWVTEIDGKAIRGEKPANDFEARAMQKLNEFYDEWEVRLKDEGLIGSEGYYKKYMLDREARLKVAEARLAKTKDAVHAKNIGTQIDRFKKEIAETKQQLDDLGAMGKLTPPNEDIFRPRYWDFSAIEANRPEFEKILAKWYQSNPETYTKLPNGKWGKVKMSSSPDAIAKRVKDTVDRMLNDPDPLDPDKMFYGVGKSKHFKHRALDIPNRLVLDYMQRNPISIMKAYTQKTSGRYEFSKKFGGGSIDDVLDGTYDKMMDAGASIDEIRATQKEQRILYDRVVGSVLRRPDAMNQGVARLLRSAAQLSYLGGAVLATITEPAKIVMEHGFAPTMKGLFSVLDKNALKMGGLEIRAAGEALERLLGNVQMRLSEDLNNNPFRGDYLDKATDAFFTLNGLGPVTRILKDFDGMMRSHTLIDYSVRWADPNKKITKMEKEYLLRYNIDEADAKRIAASNWEKTDSGLYMANTEEWAKPDFEAIKNKIAKAYNAPKNSTSSKLSKILYAKRTAPKGYSREEILKKIKTESDNDLAFHVTSDPSGIVQNGVEGGGFTIGSIHPDKGYGDYITVYNIKSLKKLHNVGKDEDLKTVYRGRSMEPEHKSKFAEELYGDGNASFDMRGTKPIAVYHISEMPDYMLKRPKGPSYEERMMGGDGEYGVMEDQFTTKLHHAYLTGKDVTKVEGYDHFNGYPRAETEADLKKYFDELQSYKNYRPTETQNLAGEKELLNMFKDEFYVGRIVTDQTIVDDVFGRQDKPNILGQADGVGLEIPATVYLNLRQIKQSYNKLKNREDLKKFKEQLEEAINTGQITDVQYRHQMGYVKNIDKFNTEADFANFVLLHELHHTTTLQRAGESLADFEQRIDDLAYNYIKNEKEAGLNLAAEKEYNKQMQEADETVQTFRNALGSGVMNTILMGTPADKPTITDGIVYIPMRVASKFGMKEDPVNKGYARIENGMLGLPFQFYSYALAAVNKTMGAYAHGQVKSKYIGASLALGLGYMTLNLKTPDWVEMSYQDKFLRSLDYSGLMPIMTDMFYTGMTTALALGGPNVTGGAIQPKFPQKPDTGEAITGILGAGPSYGLDMYRNMAELITGDVGKGTSDLVGDLPFMNIFWLRGLVNDFRKFAKDEIDMPRGIGGF